MDFVYEANNIARQKLSLRVTELTIVWGNALQAPKKIINPSSISKLVSLMGPGDLEIKD